MSDRLLSIGERTLLRNIAEKEIRFCPATWAYSYKTKNGKEKYRWSETLWDLIKKGFAAFDGTPPGEAYKEKEWWVPPFSLWREGVRVVITDDGLHVLNDRKGKA
jgi:hypothetical protein